MSVGPRALTIGVDVGGTSVRAGVVDADGEVLDTATAPTPRTDDALEVAIAGTVTEIGDNFVTVEVADNVRVRVQKAAVGNVLPKGTLKAI